MIAAVVLAITLEMFAYAFEVLTSELSAVARLVLGVAELALIATITAIVIMIAQPAAVQTPSVVTRKLSIGARGWCWAMVQSYILIGPIDTVRISVA